MKTYSRVYATVDLDAIASNMKAMKEHLPARTAVMGVVKADGYGHGAVPVAIAIEPYVESYGTATLDEGIILRRHGIKKPVLVLGITHSSRYEEFLDYDICPSIFRYEEAKQLSQLAEKKGKKAVVHLALDTGMGRIGMRPDEESADMVKQISGLAGITIQGIFTHFSSADEADKTAALLQYQAYTDFMTLLEKRGVAIPLRHCSNSAGIIEALDSNGLELVRAGISIYGLYPSGEVDHNKIVLNPAMELKSYVTYVKTIEPGDGVSYGRTFVADRPVRVATIPVGYADGYSRGLSNKGFVLIRGKRARILGRICMDQFMVDVTDIPGVKEEDTATLLGRDGKEQITAEELARLGGGFHYEILCCIGKRVPRVYLKQGEIVGTKDYFEDQFLGFC